LSATVILRGTPVLPCFYRLMGSTVGRGVYLDSLKTGTEFDLLEFVHYVV
jgi:hypothetical protein